MGKFNLILLLLICLWLGGCQVEPEVIADLSKQQENLLVETKVWHLQKIISDGKPLDLTLSENTKKIVPDSKATLSFSANEIRGDSGCNHFGGTYQAKPNGEIKISPGPITELPCPGKLAQQESQLIQLLSKVNQWQIKEDVLTLSDGTNNQQLVFSPYQAKHLPLQGTTWRVTHFTQSNNETVSAEPIQQGEEIQLTFSEDQISITSGKRKYVCQVQLKEKNLLAIELSANTKKLMQEIATPEEEKLLQYLLKMTRYTIQEKNLLLSDDEDKRGLQLRGVE